MSGPIVRTGPTPEYSKNWENVFGGKRKAKPAEAAKAQPAPKKKSAKKKAKK